MNRYKSLNKIVTTTALAASVTVANYVKDGLAAFALPGWVIFVGAFVVLALLLTWFKVFLGEIVNGLRPLRRLLLRRQYIEGTWFNIVRFKDGREMFGVLRIEPAGDGLRYGGENYDRAGNFICPFSSTMLEANFPVISFKYENDPSMKRDYGEGIVVLTFAEREGGPPVRYTGSCVDFYHTEPEKIEAWKIQDQHHLRKLDHPLHRQTAVLSFIQGYFPPTNAADKPSA